MKQRRARIHSGGAVLGEIDLALCGSRYPFNIGVSEEVTEAILTDYLTRQGGAVTRAAKLVAMEPREDGVLGTVEHQGAASEILAQWVIGCDGYHSTVCMLAGIEQDGHDIAEPWAVFDAGVSGWVDSFEANYAYLDETPVILTSLPGRRWRVYLRPTSAESDLAADALATLRRYLPEASFQDAANPARFQCHTKVAQRFRAGRILLAGDAAHTCSPAQGHGMNTGLHDAFNLAWKLALVTHGHCSETLLDSYQLERRPVAEVVLAEGDAAESAQMVAGPEARRQRDAALRTAFADPGKRHDEAIAEAELDIDYADSPIVMGDRSDTLWPGQRLPDRIEVRHASGSSLLHHHINRRGHTAFLLGGTAAAPPELTEALRDVEALVDGHIVEAAMAVAAHPGLRGIDAQLEAETLERLGVEAVTLLVVRADGHVGLRAERNHVEALAAYVELLRAPRA